MLILNCLNARRPPRLCGVKYLGATRKSSLMPFGCLWLSLYNYRPLWSSRFVSTDIGYVFHQRKCMRSESGRSVVSNSGCSALARLTPYPFRSTLLQSNPRARLGQTAGDLLFSRSAVLEHWIWEITEGQRSGNARFMKDNILNPPQPTFMCRRNCVDRKIMSQKSLNRHYKMIHPVEWAAEHPDWVAPTKR